ncbi:MAG TPA: DUF1801 domain-containing protein, partial [Longimicrobium sp.]|nr:DUF1801 domain-containing protein [Longimicrobium sp.]
MAVKGTGSKPAKGTDAAPDDVDAFVAALDHLRTAEILALRRIILGADARIGEGIKWNAPSYRTSDWFATTHLRAKEGVHIIMHFGAKKRADFAPRAAIDDPESILEWLAADRAVAKF